MKKWIKYTFLSLFLLLIVGGKFYSKPSIDVFSVKHTSIQSTSENKAVFLSIAEDFTLVDFFVENDEEDHIQSDTSNHYFLENNFQNIFNIVFDHHFVKKKTKYSNKKSLHLLSKIYLLICNIRI